MMSRKPVRKPRKDTAPPLREDNPHWLTTDPTGAPPPPPIKAKKDSLPLSDIEWPDFERLCRRMALLSGSVETAYVYGGPGHAQQGIDILVRMVDGSLEVWQSKRYKKFKAADVNAAVDLFSKHEWAGKAKRLVLAVTSDFNDPEVINAISVAAAKLKENGIAFDAKDQRLLTEMLRPHPILVDDFFGGPWVDAVCGSEAAASLKDRFSRFDIDNVRVRLRDLYTAWIAAVDPGLPIAGPDKDGRPIPAPKLSDTCCPISF